MAGGDDRLALARHYVDIDRPQRALDALETASDEALSDPEFWLLRAEALRELERPDEAADAARRGLALDPDDVFLLDALALAELDGHRLGAAADALAAALELEPDHPVLLAHRALVLANAKRFGEARAAVVHALRLDPESVDVRRVRAQVAVLSEEPDADRYVEELLELSPEDRTGHLLRGSLAAERSRYGPAARAFAEAARLDPSDRDVARVARETRVAAHPVLAPVRAVHRYGRWRAYFTYLTLVVILGAAGLQSLRVVLVVVWLVIVVLSWTGPRFLRWRERRKYGEL
jgi:tetratricopeptide (TPR) repeat protein